MPREISLDRRWKRLQSMPWPWRVSEKGNLYTIARGYILIVRADGQRKRWRCSFRPESADAANWENSGYVFPTEEDAKQWGLQKVGLTKLVSPPPPPVTGAARRRIQLPDD